MRAKAIQSKAVSGVIKQGIHGPKLLYGITETGVRYADGIRRDAMHTIGKKSQAEVSIQ